MGVLTLRARLLLALAYVLVLAIGSMLVPLVRSVRDRVDAEVKTQALGQAEVVAATAAGDVRPSTRWSTTSAREVRGRVLIVDRDGVVVADSEPGRRRRRLLDAVRDRRPRCAGGSRAGAARQRDARTSAILATAVPIVRDGETDGAVRVTQSVDAVGRAVRSATIGPRAGRPDRARAGAGGGRAARGVA